MVTISGPMLGQSAAAQRILRALPQWFGIEEATQEYIQAVGNNPTFLAYAPGVDTEAIGFLTLVQHSASAAEIYVMGVLPDYHRQGVGRELVQAAEAYLGSTGVGFLQVKTLSDKHPDAGYGRTRAFYEAMGFRLLEEFIDLWGPNNPCWQLIKVVSQ